MASKRSSSTSPSEPFKNYLGVEDQLAISFHRSYGVPDNAVLENQRVFQRVESQISQPLDFAKEKGDKKNAYVLCMRSFDPMAIRISASSGAFKVRIKLGEVNVAAPTLEFGQDYFIACSKSEEQSSQWVDGVAYNLTPRRVVRQFVGVQCGTGHSFQDQLHDIKSNREFKIEITNTASKPYIPNGGNTGSVNPKGSIKIILAYLAGGISTYTVESSTTLLELKHLIEKVDGCPVDLQRLIYNGKQLTEAKKTMSDYNIQQEAKLHNIIKTWGGGGPKIGAYRDVDPRHSTAASKSRNLEIAPGGLIYQDLLSDTGEYKWEESPITTFTVRIVDAAGFESSTGLQPPPRPASPVDSMKAVGWNEMKGNPEIKSISEHEETHRSPVPFTPREVEAPNRW